MTEVTSGCGQDPELKEKMEQTIWIAHSLFQRGKTAGSTANISFYHRNYIYISGSGTCFGTLCEEDFAVTDMEGNLVEGSRKPSKELPLHQMLYQYRSETGAVIHTHSFYATLWSCLKHDNTSDVIPNFTPYLKMKLGTVGLIPFAQPGSQKLFEYFRQCLSCSDGYLLQNHGPVIGGRDIMDAFFLMEELEESARIAWYLRSEDSAFKIL